MKALNVMFLQYEGNNRRSFVIFILELWVNKYLIIIATDPLSILNEVDGHTHLQYPGEPSVAELNPGCAVYM